MFANRKREGIDSFVCAVSLYVAETPKASIKNPKPPLPIIPFGIVAYGFVGQPFSKQLFTLIAELHARSLAHFYRQFADRHMNEIHAMRQRARVSVWSESERVDPQLL